MHAGGGVDGGELWFQVCPVKFDPLSLTNRTLALLTLTNQPAHNPMDGYRAQTAAIMA
jgi:hypothetical protein